MPAFFRVGGIGLGRVRLLTKVPGPKNPLPGHSGLPTFRDIKIGGFGRAETHPVPSLLGSIPIPHMHLDFLGKELAKHHIPFPSQFATAVGLGTGALSGRACGCSQ